jgi:hypothetical protein
VADVVRLDANNRRLVAQGLKRVRALAMPCGIASLFIASGRSATVATTFDFGFALGPRINAAGRLSDMTLGIECLLTDDPARADELARVLDGINRERRVIEGDMREQAMQIAESLFEEGDEAPPAICVFDPDFHEGVVGIVASRIKDKLHRPAFVFAASGRPARSTNSKARAAPSPVFTCATRWTWLPSAPRRAAALWRPRHGRGLHHPRGRSGRFEQGLHRRGAGVAGCRHPDPPAGDRRPAGAQYRRVDLVDTLHKEVWGQGFAPPTFSEEVEVLSQRLVGEKHLALKLKHQGQPVDGIWFGHTEPLPAKVTLAFRLDADEWNGVRRVRFLVEGAIRALAASRLTPAVRARALTRDHHLLVQATKIGLFLHLGYCDSFGQPVHNFSAPDIHGKRLQRCENGHHDVAERAGRNWLVVVHKNQFATGLGHAQRFRNRLAPHIGWLLVQQEEHHTLSWLPSSKCSAVESCNDALTCCGLLSLVCRFLI